MPAIFGNPEQLLTEDTSLLFPPMAVVNATSEFRRNSSKLPLTPS